MAPEFGFQLDFRPLVGCRPPARPRLAGVAATSGLWWGVRGSYEATGEKYLPAGVEGRRPDGHVHDRDTTAGTSASSRRTSSTTSPSGPIWIERVRVQPEWTSSSARARLIGRGIGSEAIARFVAAVVFARPDHASLRCRSRRAQPRLAARLREGRVRATTNTFLDPEDGRLHALVRRERGRGARGCSAAPAVSRPAAAARPSDTISGGCGGLTRVSLATRSRAGCAGAGHRREADEPG